MDKRLEKDIKNLVAELQAHSYSQGKSWNGYEVYIPEYDKLVFVGLPSVILVKDGVARISTPDEAMEYLDYDSAE